MIHIVSILSLSYKATDFVKHKAPKKISKKQQGVLIWDTEDKEHIDFACGIAVMNVGNFHPYQ